TIAALWWWMFGGAVVLAALVFVLLGLAMRKRKTARPARRGVWIVGLGLVMPGVVLATLLAAALHVGSRTLPHGEALRIGAEASRWEWAFSYPGGRTS